MVDENLFDVVNDVMDEKREEYNEWLEEQKEEDGMSETRQSRSLANGGSHGRQA